MITMFDNKDGSCGRTSRTVHQRTSQQASDCKNRNNCLFLQRSSSGFDGDGHVPNWVMFQRRQVLLNKQTHSIQFVSLNHPALLDIFGRDIEKTENADGSLIVLSPPIKFV